MGRWGLLFNNLRDQVFLSCFLLIFDILIVLGHPVLLTAAKSKDRSYLLDELLLNLILATGEPGG